MRADDDLDVLRPHSELLQLSEDTGRLFGGGIRASRILGHSRVDQDVAPTIGLNQVAACRHQDRTAGHRNVARLLVDEIDASGPGHRSIIARMWRQSPPSASIAAEILEDARLLSW